MRALAAIALTLTACEARVGGQVGDSDANPDPTDGPVIDPDTQPVCQKRQLFLSFEGETLTAGATSDAKVNVASWMSVASATTPRYHTNQADRLTDITIIVDEVTARLTPFAITVTTTRPVTGDYMMIVFGGNAAAVGSAFGFVQELDCGDLVRNDVAWADDGFPDALIPNAVIGSIGFAIGLTATVDPTDCMCSWDNNCSQTTNNCQLHNGIARDPNANQTCAGAPVVQDAIVELNTAFCN